MAAIESLALNWRRPVTNPGYVQSVAANYGTDGRSSFWHWLRATMIPNAPMVNLPMWNVLQPINYHTGVTVVPVVVRTPVQTTPQMAFTPAGTATAVPGVSPPNVFAQVWTGVGTA